jgi:DNA/RNA endonuclease YhcR with UshA esterase domain
MGFRILCTALLLLLVAGDAATVSSQEKAGAQAPQAFPYSVDQEVALQGKVDQVKDYKCPVTGRVGSHITVTTDNGPIEVHLAPASFLKDYEIVFKPGDSVKIVGVKITFEGKPAVLARSVSIGRESFMFRDAKGRPLW